MSQEQIDALIAFVRAAVRSAVAEAHNKDEWAHDRFDKAETELRLALAKEPTP